MSLDKPFFKPSMCKLASALSLKGDVSTCSALYAVVLPFVFLSSEEAEYMCLNGNDGRFGFFE